MKSTIIKKASARALNAALNRPFTIASGSHQSLENALIKLELADGTIGYGEAAPAKHITGEGPEEVLKDLRMACEELVGCDAANYHEISCVMREMFPSARCAVTAIEMALVDALCRYVKMPAWKFFGTKANKLHTDMTVVIGTPEDALLQAKQIYARGIRAFKIKVGADEKTDFERVLAVGRAVKACPVYLDANEGFTAAEMLRFIKEIKKAGVNLAFVEQPVPRGDWDGLKKVSRLAGVCVGADESVYDISDLYRLIKEKAAPAVNIKIMKFGVLGGFEMARLASANGLRLMIGGMMESALAMHCSAHMASALGCFDFIDLDTSFFVKDRIMKGGCLSPKGVYDPALVKAGIGVVPSEK